MPDNTTEKYTVVSVIKDLFLFLMFVCPLKEVEVSFTYFWVYVRSLISFYLHLLR